MATRRARSLLQSFFVFILEAVEVVNSSTPISGRGAAIATKVQCALKAVHRVCCGKLPATQVSMQHVNTSFPFLRTLNVTTAGVTPPHSPDSTLAQLQPSLIKSKHNINL